MKIDFFNLGQVKAKGWLEEFLNRDLNGFSLHMDELCAEVRSDAFGKGRTKDLRNTNWWNGESETHWINAVVYLAYVTGDPIAMAKAGKYVENIITNQEEDGYIGVYSKDWRYNVIEGKSNGEFWSQHGVLINLLLFYECTHEEKVLKAAIKLADLTTEKYGPIAGGRSYFCRKDPSGGTGHGLSIIEPMLLLYEITGYTKYLDFAVFCYEDYSNSDMTKYSDLKFENALDKNIPLYGHGAHTCEHIKLPLMLYYYTKEEKYKKCFSTTFKKLIQTMSVSGAVKCDEMISVEGEKCVPLSTSGYEYCGIAELIFSLHYALSLTGDMLYADYAERLLFNAAMASRKSDGKSILYLGADDLFEATQKRGKRWKYSPTHSNSAVCCSPNAARMMPCHLSRMYMKLPEDKGLFIPFYGPSNLETSISGVKIKVQQSTAYPFEGIVNFKVSAEKDVLFSMILRVPDWASSVELSINGSTQAVHNKDRKILLERVWKSNDQISICFGMDISAVRTPNNMAAVTRGPLVFSLDIPAKAEVLRKYDIEGFFDLALTPEANDIWTWDYTLITGGFGVQKNLYETEISLTKKFPWDVSPVKINTLMFDRDSKKKKVELIPIGCTDLRRTAFPWVEQGF